MFPTNTRTPFGVLSSSPLDPRIPYFPQGTPYYPGPPQDEMEDDPANVRVSGQIPPMGALQQEAPAVPKKAATAFDKENRQRTFLAMAQAFGSNQNFFEGLGAAAGNVGSVMDDLKAKQKKLLPEIGGPDNSFEITTDPETGKRTYTPIAVFQDYKNGTRVKNKDVMDQEGRINDGIMQLPEKDRPAAYADVLANPKRYNVDTTDWPAAYDPRFTAIAARAGSNVSQSRAGDTRDRATDSRIDQSERRLGVYSQRAADLTRQGDARIDQGQQRLNKAPPSTRKGGGKSSGGGSTTRPGGPTGLMMRVRKKK